MRQSCLHKVVLVNKRGRGWGERGGLGEQGLRSACGTSLSRNDNRLCVTYAVLYSSSCIFNFGRVIILTPEASENEFQVPGLMVVVVIITIMLMMIVYHCIITTPLDCIKKSETKTYIIWVLRESSIFDQLSFVVNIFKQFL